MKRLPMAPTDTCPDKATLEAFLQGRLTPEEVNHRAAHVESCPECIAQLKTILQDDSLQLVFRDQALSKAELLPDGLRKIMNSFSSLDKMRSGTMYLENGVTPPMGRSLRPAEEAREAGRLGGYQVLRVLGQGGMGTVFEAEDITLKRRVALKVMKPAIAANPAARERFQREAELMASLKHDHIVTIFQVSEHCGTPFLAMELLHGESLHDRLANAPLPVSETLHIGLQLARGLEAAHKCGLIHRDIKPANIWLERKEPAGSNEEPELLSPDSWLLPPSYRVKILDFGLARPAKEDGTLTGSGIVLGTPSYMAPEQARGEAVTTLCDLYSLGCILYRMSTGQLPVAGKGVMAVLTNLATVTPRAPRDLNPTIPPALDALIRSLLDQEPRNRPPTARAVIDALQSILVDPGQSIPPARKPTAGSRRRRVAVAFAAFLMAGLIATVLHIRTAPRSEPQPKAVAAEPTPRVVDLQVHANQAWTATGLVLEDGMVLEITASGKVDASAETQRPYFMQVPPEGREERVGQVPQPTLPGLCLLGKIAPAQVFYVGAKLRLPIDASRVGPLYLGINDDIVADNSGAWDVHIVAHPPSTGAKK